MGGGSLPNFSFSKVTPKFFHEIVKFTSQFAWKQIFMTLLTLARELGIITNVSFYEENFSS